MKKALKIREDLLLPLLTRVFPDPSNCLLELVSNAYDAFRKLEECTAAQDLSIHIDAQEGCLSISDNGIGMSEDEVEHYLGQVPYSSTPDFLGQEQLSPEWAGIGIFTCFAIASQVDVDTLSYKEGSRSVRWSSTGNTEYELTKGTRQQRGSTVTLHLRSEYAHFLKPTTLEAILLPHFRFLQYPLFVAGKRITADPIWLKDPDSCSKEDYLNFYQDLYPGSPQPLLWAHFQHKGEIPASGILYLSSDAISRQFYTNRCFKDPRLQDLIPQFMSRLNGFIDSPDTPYDQVRSQQSARQRFQALINTITESLAKRIAEAIDPASWEKIDSFAKQAALENGLFRQILKDQLLWRNSAGTWIPAPQESYWTTPDKIHSFWHIFCKENAWTTLVVNQPQEAELLPKSCLQLGTSVPDSWLEPAQDLQDQEKALSQALNGTPVYLRALKSVKVPLLISGHGIFFNSKHPVVKGMLTEAHPENSARELRNLALLADGEVSKALYQGYLDQALATQLKTYS